MSRKRGRDHKARESRYAVAGGQASVYDEIQLMELLDGIETPFLLILDCVQDPHNLGACLRTANAAGVHAVVAPRRKSAPMTETVINIASGAAGMTPFAQVTNLARTIDDLKELGIRVVGATHSAPRLLHEENLTGPIAVVMGSEGTGMRRLTEDKCDALVSIPMLGSVDCLNVSVATGVCLFEAVRQRSQDGAISR